MLGQTLTGKRTGEPCFEFHRNAVRCDGRAESRGTTEAEASCPSWSRLKVEPQRVLDFASVVDLRRDAAKLSTHYAQVRITGHHAVRQIVSFQSQFHLESLGQREILRKRRVELPESRARIPAI